MLLLFLSEIDGKFSRMILLRCWTSLLVEHCHICIRAEMVDISEPVTDFKEKVSEPVSSYPFELDIFQKQAILKLKERQYVF